MGTRTRSHALREFYVQPPVTGPSFIRDARARGADRRPLRCRALRSLMVRGTAASLLSLPTNSLRSAGDSDNFADRLPEHLSRQPEANAVGFLLGSRRLQSRLDQCAK